jgi:hypothetical protein
MADACKESILDFYGFPLELTAAQLAVRDRCDDEEEKQESRWAKYAKRKALPTDEATLKKLCRKVCPQLLLDAAVLVTRLGCPHKHWAVGLHSYDLLSTLPADMVTLAAECCARFSGRTMAAEPCKCIGASLCAVCAHWVQLGRLRGRRGLGRLFMARHRGGQVTAFRVIFIHLFASIFSAVNPSKQGDGNLDSNLMHC